MPESMLLLQSPTTPAQGEPSSGLLGHPHTCGICSSKDTHIKEERRRRKRTEALRPCHPVGLSVPRWEQVQHLPLKAAEGRGCARAPLTTLSLLLLPLSYTRSLILIHFLTLVVVLNNFSCLPVQIPLCLSLLYSFAVSSFSSTVFIIPLSGIALAIPKAGAYPKVL